VDLAGLTAEFDAMGTDGQLHRIKLQYAPECRWIDGRQYFGQEYMDGGLMASEYVQDTGGGSLLLDRPGYPSHAITW
jgi:hypothetical protein